jgi:uncharacterized DUF497 family protein
MKVDGFDWNSSNTFKNETKHGISRELIESFFEGRIWVAPDVKHSHSEDRFLAIGSDPNGRPMIVAFTFRTKGGLKLIRAISARYMHAKEAKKYEQAFTKDEK